MYEYDTPSVPNAKTVVLIEKGGGDRAGGTSRKNLSTIPAGKQRSFGGLTGKRSMNKNGRSSEVGGWIVFARGRRRSTKSKSGGTNLDRGGAKKPTSGSHCVVS